MRFFYVITLNLFFTLFLVSGECTNKIDAKIEEINLMVEKNGGVMISSCKNISPYIYIVLVNLDDSRNQISITHATKTKNGYPLHTITELAKLEDATIAVNGFTWIGDYGFRLGGFAVSPTGTVYSKSKELNIRKNGKEVVMAFGKRTYKGTKVELIDRASGEELEEKHKINADNSTTSIIKHGSDKSTDTKYFTSSIGVGKLNDKNVLVILSSSLKEKASIKEHYEIFDYFHATEAMRLDGSTATSLYYNGFHVNPLDSYLYGSARHIMYSITVKTVPPLPKPQAPTLNGGVNIVPIEGGFKINSQEAQGQVDRYEFYRSTTAGELGENIYSGKANSYEDKGLTDGTTYYYTAKACNDAGCDTSNQDYNTYYDNSGGDDDPTQDPNKVCVSNYFNYYGDGKIHDDLKIGDKDAELYSDGTKHQVKELQEFLMAFGYDVGSSGADGWFGDDTKDAVVAFQSANGLNTDGIIGPNTKDVMNSLNCFDK